MTEAGVASGRRIGAALTVTLLVLPGALHAQLIRGRVVDAGTGLPIPFASVSLVSGEGVEVRAGMADADGRFHLTPPMSGSHYLYAEGLGYLTSFEGPLALTPADTLDVEFSLQAVAIEMDSLRVRAEPRPRQLEVVGFFQRKELGLGTFIGEEEIQRRAPRQMSDLFWTVPGFRLVPAGDGGSTFVLVSRRMSSIALGACTPAIYLDGIPQDSGFIDRIVDPFDVRAVEVYSGAGQVPAEYAGADSGCGVVLIWTR